MTDDLRLHEIIDEAVALIATDFLYLERDPAGVQLDMKVPVSVLASHFEAGAPVQSVFGRIGAVAAAGGDYTASQVTNVAAGDIAAETVQAAIDELDADKQPILPAVDETPIVFKTGVPANTLTLDVTPFTAARVATWPDADIKVPGTNISNMFTAAQTIDVNSAAALLVEQNGVNENVLVVDTATGRVGVSTAAPGRPLDVTGELISNISRGFRVNADALGDHRAILGTFTYLDSRTDILTNTSYGMLVGNNNTTNNNYAAFGMSSDGGSVVAGVLALRNVNHVARQSDWIFINRNGDPQEALTIKYTGHIGFGNPSPLTRIHAIDEDAATSTVTTVATFSHNSTDTPITNFGTGLRLSGKSSTENNRDMAKLQAIWDNATHATRSAAFQILISQAAGDVAAAKFDDDATARNTRFLVWDVDNAALERVSVGIADSGGAGFKLLRIVN